MKTAEEIAFEKIMPLVSKDNIYRALAGAGMTRKEIAEKYSLVYANVRYMIAARGTLTNIDPDALKFCADYLMENKSRVH